MSPARRVAALLGAIAVVAVVLALTSGSGEEADEPAVPASPSSSTTTTTTTLPTLSRFDTVSPGSWSAPRGLWAADDGVRACGADDFVWALGPNEGRFGSSITLTNVTPTACRLPVELTMSFTGRQQDRATGTWSDVARDVDRQHPLADHYVDPHVEPGQAIGLRIRAPNYLLAEDGPLSAVEGEQLQLAFPDGSMLAIDLVPEAYGHPIDWAAPTAPWNDPPVPPCDRDDLDGEALAVAERADGGATVEAQVRNRSDAWCRLDDRLWVYAVRLRGEDDVDAERLRTTGTASGEGDTVPVLANPMVPPGGAIGFLIEAAPLENVPTDYVAIQIAGSDETAGIVIELDGQNLGRVTEIIGPLPSPAGR